MNVTVNAFRFVDGKPENSPYKEFDIAIDASYNPYEENTEFINELCNRSAQRLGTSGLSASYVWRSKQEKECEIVITYFDNGGVQTNVVKLENGVLTSARQRLEEREGKFFLKVIWK